MARYYLDERHFLDGIWYPAGAVIDWDGPKSEHMVPIEDHLKRRENRHNPENRARVVSNPNASPPAVSANTQPAKVAMAGPEEPAVAAALPDDERNPDFVRPNLSRPLNPGVEEAAAAPTTEPSEAKK